MVFARTRLAQRHLGWQFERRQVRKAYVARVAGEMAEPVGLIDLPLACDWPNRPRQMVTTAGRSAVTEWEVIGVEAGTTRVQLWPMTGRSHQLRVHLAEIGHPILGDPIYGPEPAADLRLQLHAERLAFRHPLGGAWVEFRAEVPF
jgi:tRNA pseudouridine32 synthase/23S rRNA pseudouridine746 synthase